jgi:hypothetical protein
MVLSQRPFGLHSTTAKAECASKVIHEALTAASIRQGVWTFVLAEIKIASTARRSFTMRQHLSS